MVRRISTLLAVLALALGSAATSAHADELFVLDNGTVLKGTVLKEGDGKLVLRLSGFLNDAQVTLATARVVERKNITPEGIPIPPPEVTTTASVASAPPPPTAVQPEKPVPETAPLTDVPDGEPSIQSEGFFERLARVAVQGMPADSVGRATLAVLLLIALMAVVGMGGRMAEIETLTLGRAMILSLLLGTLLVGDVIWRNELLRADRAIWALPAQALLWLGAAGLILRENFGRVVLLFAFVLFSISLVVFSAGAILIAF